MEKPCHFCGTLTVQEPGSEPVCIKCRMPDGFETTRFTSPDGDFSMVFQGWKRPAVIIAPNPSYTGWSSVADVLFVRRPLLALPGGE